MFNNKVKARAMILRRSGRSLEEIKSLTGVSKGTLSLWLKDVSLDKNARDRLLDRQMEGRRKVAAILATKKITRKENARLKAAETLRSIQSNKEQERLLCALIYYCEGSKSDQRVAFTNSDPELMKTFLLLLRKSFSLDESRIRACMHLHSYHDEKKQKLFWSSLMNISEKNFIKSYQKTEGGTYKREGYQGCVTVRYHDASVARELLETARQYFKKVR